MKKIVLSLLAAAALAACAKSTNEIQPTYTSPLQYNSYSCKQIEMEMARLSRRVSEVGGAVNETASSDDAEMAVGLILFWPTLFFLDGDTPQSQEYARLKGEFDALEQAAIQKECNIKIEYPKIPNPNDKEKQQEAYPTKGRK